MGRVVRLRWNQVCSNSSLQLYLLIHFDLHVARCLFECHHSVVWSVHVRHLVIQKWVGRHSRENRVRIEVLQGHFESICKHWQLWRDKLATPWLAERVLGETTRVSHFNYQCLANILGF